MPEFKVLVVETRQKEGLSYRGEELQFGLLKSELLYLQEFESTEQFKAVLIAISVTTTAVARQSLRVCA